MAKEWEETGEITGNAHQAFNYLLAVRPDSPEDRDVKLIFTGGHISLVVPFKGPK